MSKAFEKLVPTADDMRWYNVMKSGVKLNCTASIKNY